MRLFFQQGSVFKISTIFQYLLECVFFYRQFLRKYHQNLLCINPQSHIFSQENSIKPSNVMPPIATHTFTG